MQLKKFKRGLVVGKFSPLHKGHELLIKTALENCEELIILAYGYLEYDNCDVTNRKNWLEAIFPAAKIYVFNRQTEPAIPKDEASDFEQREFVAKYYLEKINLPLDAIFTSETYGVGFAKHMTDRLVKVKLQNQSVEHILVDQERSKVPVSGTEIRRNLNANRKYLSDVVYKDFVKKILFLGAESTGKSTLCELAQKKFNTVLVEEYGRTFWIENNGKLNYEDMVHIARTQQNLELKQQLLADKYLFVDTSPLTTLLYSYFMFGKAEQELIKLAAQLDYDLIFLCAPDFPMVQDGTRQDESFRMRQHNWYLETLSERNIKYTLLTGTLENKFTSVVNLLTTL